MYVTKTTKNYSKIIPLSAVKDHLRVIGNEDDGQLQRLLETATDIVANRIKANILPTTVSLEDYCLYDSCYTVYEPNIAISSITVTNNVLTTPITTIVTGYTLMKGSQYTTIRFFNFVQAEKINISYSSGYSAIPLPVQQAILLTIGLLYDVDRNGYTQSVTESPTITRLLAPYQNILY